MTLTVETIDNAKPGINVQGKPTDKPYKMGDSGGLFLLVSPKGGKWWRFKYRLASKENQVSLGVYPQVSLAEARRQREILRTLLADGINPSIHLKLERSARRVEEELLAAKKRFMLDNSGALSFGFNNRHVSLSASETAELRAFLDATKAIQPEGTPCT